MLNKPSEFNGDKSKFKSWFRRISLYIKDCPQLYLEEKKIDFLFSYITGPKVEAWVEAYYAKNYDWQASNEGSDPWKVTYQRVRQDIEGQFTDLNKARIAQDKIEVLKQGSNSAEDFFQEFEVLLIEAEYQKNNNNVI